MIDRVIQIQNYNKLSDNDSNQSLPYAIMRCTCEKYPRITATNKCMDELVLVDPDHDRWEDFTRDNIFFMIPFEERDLFKEYLHEADTSDVPVSMEHSVIRSDGSHIPVVGWVKRSPAAGGRKEYIFIYMQMTEGHKRRQNHRENSYFKALTSAYNFIFEINNSKQTVELIYGHEESTVRKVHNVCMTTESAIEYWGGNYVVPEDLDMAKDYFRLISSPGAIEKAGRPLQIELNLMKGEERVRFMGVAVDLDRSTVLLCWRNISQVRYISRDTNSATGKIGFGINGTQQESGHIFIRTFGYFDVFVDGKPVQFTGAKEKELLALLVDRKGGIVTSENAIAYLWEDEEVSDKMKARYRRVAMGLKNTLEANGIGHILINERGRRHLDTSAVTCDYYEAVYGNQQYKDMFSGVYMQEYSWAEETLGLLIQTT